MSNFQSRLAEAHIIGNGSAVYGLATIGGDIEEDVNQENKADERQESQAEEQPAQEPR